MYYISELRCESEQPVPLILLLDSHEAKPQTKISLLEDIHLVIPTSLHLASTFNTDLNRSHHVCIGVVGCTVGSGGSVGGCIRLHTWTHDTLTNLRERNKA